MKEITNYHFQVAHLDFLELPEWFAKSNANLEEIAATIANYTAFSIIYDGRLIAIYGFRAISSHSFEVFVIPSVYVEENAVKTMRHLKSCIQTAFSVLPGQRFQTYSLDSERVNAFMEFLGFLQEGTCRNYNANGDTFKMWAYFTDGV